MQLLKDALLLGDEEMSMMNPTFNLMHGDCEMWSFLLRYAYTVC